VSATILIPYSGWRCRACGLWLPADADPAVTPCCDRMQMLRVRVRVPKPAWSSSLAAAPLAAGVVHERPALPPTAQRGTPATTQEESA